MHWNDQSKKSGMILIIPMHPFPLKKT